MDRIMIVIEKTMWLCILDIIDVSLSEELWLCIYALQGCSPGGFTAKTPVDFRGFGTSYCLRESLQGHVIERPSVTSLQTLLAFFTVLSYEGKNTKYIGSCNRLRWIRKVIALKKTLHNWILNECFFYNRRNVNFWKVAIHPFSISFLKPVVFMFHIQKVLFFSWGVRGKEKYNSYRL